jgi:hypothetical protein
MAMQIEFVVHHQTTAGPVALNERTDRFEIDGKWVEIRVMGGVPAREPKGRGLARLLRPRPVHAADARPGQLTATQVSALACAEAWLEEDDSASSISRPGESE